jgi:hypothetical protein
VDRLQVTRRVRAAAALSTSEAQFVRTAQTLDLLVRPRYAKDGTGAVVGYSAAVAPRPGTGERPVWFGGGRLDWRLSLQRMRARWAEDEQGLTRTVVEWRRAGAWHDPARPARRAGGRASRSPGTGDVTHTHHQLDALQRGPSLHVERL